jgi:uncharacterized membrane protein
MVTHPKAHLPLQVTLLHPILVTPPIGFLVAALLPDAAYYIGSPDPIWSRASLWLLGAGVVSGVIAAIGGLIDFAGSSLSDITRRRGFTSR